VGLLHKTILDEFKAAMIWGSSVKQTPGLCGLKHTLHDEDVLQVVKMTQAEKVRAVHGKKTGTTVAGGNIKMDAKTLKERKEKSLRS